MNVTALAKTCGLSRSTVLYYESIELLRPARRTGANYRAYGQADVERLRLICSYRAAGLTLDDIRTLLHEPSTDAADVLKRRLAEITEEMERLRGHQRSIAALLMKSGQLRRMKMVTKDKLVAVMRKAGLTDDDMQRFHAEFEKSAPEEHQEFLEFLHIPAEEVAKIREWSRT